MFYQVPSAFCEQDHLSWPARAEAQSVWLVVGPDGRTHDIRVQQSLGMGLDEKAIEAIRQWKFEPGRKDGIPVAVQVDVEVNFHLY